MSIHMRVAFPAVTALLLAVAPMAHAKTVDISGSFKAEGAASTALKGKVTGTFDTVTDKITYNITYSGLSGPVKAAHFHGPAGPGETAGVLLPIPGPYRSGMQGTLTANAATAKALMAGKTYVNLHTVKYPTGEARAQISVGS